MSGERLTLTPWARAVAGDTTALRERIPEGGYLHGWAESARGTFHAELRLADNSLLKSWDRKDFLAAVDRVLARAAE